MSEQFKLATVSSAGSPPFVALGLGQSVVALNPALIHFSAAGRARRRLQVAGMLELLADWEANFDLLQEVVSFLLSQGLEDERWREAVSTPERLHFHAPLQPPTMIYAAVNYPRPGRASRAELASGSRPLMFQKTSNCITGPYDDIVKPAACEQVDWEVELAVVMGTRTRDIASERALDNVAGYLVANDVTVRDFRKPGEKVSIPGPDWFGSKCHESFAPLGPWLVPRAFVGDCDNLHLTLKVNGETRQDANSGEMIFTTQELIAHVAAQFTLEPGDLISTGTPNGIGMQSGHFLKVGDVVEAEIEGLGMQRNRVVAPARAR